MSEWLDGLARYAFAFAAGVWVTLALFYVVTRAEDVGYVIGLR